jgi:hypothetical protein
VTGRIGAAEMEFMERTENHVRKDPQYFGLSLLTSFLNTKKRICHISEADSPDGR